MAVIKPLRRPPRPVAPPQGPERQGSFTRNKKPRPKAQPLTVNVENAATVGRIFA